MISCLVVNTAILPRCPVNNASQKLENIANSTAKQYLDVIIVWHAQITQMQYRQCN